MVEGTYVVNLYDNGVLEDGKRAWSAYIWPAKRFTQELSGSVLAMGLGTSAEAAIADAAVKVGERQHALGLST